jgi:hypothetical protein
MVFLKDLNLPQNESDVVIPGAEADMIRYLDGFFRFSFEISSVFPIFAPPKKALLQ